MDISLTRYLSRRFPSHATSATVRVWPELAGAELANDQVDRDAAARPAAGLGLRRDRRAARVGTVSDGPRQFDQVLQVVHG